MRTIRLLVAAVTSLGVGFTLIGPASPAQANLEAISIGDSAVYVIDGVLYSVSTGSHEVERGDTLTSTQTGDVRVRKFQPRSGGDTARFSGGEVLEITGAAPSGQYLGRPSVFPIRSGLLFCRVNPAATEDGRAWTVDTAVYSTESRTWSQLRRAPVATPNGRTGACLAVAGGLERRTVIVGTGTEMDQGAALIALTYDGADAPTVRSYVHRTGWIRGASAAGIARVGVNAASGLVELYEGDKIPVTFAVNSVILREDGTFRRVLRQYLMFFDVARVRWTPPRQIFSSGVEGSEGVVGEMKIDGVKPLVSPDGASVHLLAGFSRIDAVPEWPSLPVTSVTRLPEDSPFYASSFVVGLSPENAARRDLRVSSGWTLTFTDDTGPRSFPITIYREGATGAVVFAGFGAAVTPEGRVRNARLTFTGNREGDFVDAELEWSRLMQTTSQGVLSRTLRGDELSPVVTLPGVRSENGDAEIEVRYTATVDGIPVIVTDVEDSRSRDSLESMSLIDGEWTRPQVVVSRYDSDDYDEPIAFMPYLRRTALVGAQSPASTGPAFRSEPTAGIIRRVFTGGRWGDAQHIRALTRGDGQTVPAVARVTGSGGPVEVEVFNRNPGVAIAGATYDEAERINGSPFGTITFTYRGELPRRIGGFLSVDGWDSSIGWSPGSYDPVIDLSARTLKVSAPTPRGPVPTGPARVVWQEHFETVYVVDRRR